VLLGGEGEKEECIIQKRSFVRELGHPLVDWLLNNTTF